MTLNNALFKQMASQWPSNLWLVIELVIITVVTWWITDILAQAITPFLEPSGHDISHVYKLTFDRIKEPFPGEADMSKPEEWVEMTNRLRRYPGVEDVSVSMAAAPYRGSMYCGMTSDVTTTDTIQYPGGVNDRNISFGWANPGTFRVFRITGMRGESPDSLASLMRTSRTGSVISPELAECIDSGLPVPDPYSLIGHKFRPMMRSDDDLEVVGVAPMMKRYDYDLLGDWASILTVISAGELGNWVDLAIRVTPEADKEFMERFRADMKDQMRTGRLYITDIIPYSRLKSESEEMVDGIILKFLLIGVFLLVNVFLGLLGTFWYRTRCRLNEIAIRRVFGATRTDIFGSLMAEGFILLALALPFAAGLIWLMVRAEIDMDVYGPHITNASDYVRDSLITLATMAAVIALGIWLPARAATRIDPAENLSKD